MNRRMTNLKSLEEAQKKRPPPGEFGRTEIAISDGLEFFGGNSVSKQVSGDFALQCQLVGRAKAMVI
mgnify:CR=1 FL=1